MFSKNLEEQHQEPRGSMEGDNETVIGPSVKVEGDFVGEGSVLVQGVVNGNLKTKGRLRVEKDARIKADVEAVNATVHGSVKGNIVIQENLEVGASAVIDGDITAKVLSVAPGATINGHCTIGSSQKNNEAIVTQKKESKQIRA